MSKTHQFNEGDRVRWRHPEPGVDSSELVGKITVIDNLSNEVSVRFDSGDEDKCDADDLVMESA